MFVRQKRRNQGSTVTYLQLVENKRVEGKTRQRVLCTSGRADDPKLRVLGAACLDSPPVRRRRGPGGGLKQPFDSGC